MRTIEGTKRAGINRVMWNLTQPPPPNEQGRGGGGGGFGGGRGGGARPVDPGTYIVTLEANGQRLSQSVTVLADEWLGQK